MPPLIGAVYETVTASVAVAARAIVRLTRVPLIAAAVTVTAVPATVAENVVAAGTALALSA